MENWIPVSKLWWKTRHMVEFGLFGGPLFTWDFSNIGSIVKKFWYPEKIRPARRFSWRKSKKTLSRPFIDVIFRGEFDSGVEIGVGNPAHGQIWAFWGTTFHLRFFQHRVNREKISHQRTKSVPPGAFCDGSRKKELDSGVEIGVGNPAHGQIWAFWGTTFHLIPT